MPITANRSGRHENYAICNGTFAGCGRFGAKIIIAAGGIVKGPEGLD